jgi:hypothetical protein
LPVIFIRMNTTKILINNSTNDVLYTIHSAIHIVRAVALIYYTYTQDDKAERKKYRPFIDEVLRLYGGDIADVEYRQQIAADLWTYQLGELDMQVTYVCKSVDPVSWGLFLVAEGASISQKSLNQGIYTEAEFKRITKLLLTLAQGDLIFYDARKVPELKVDEDGVTVEV